MNNEWINQYRLLMGAIAILFPHLCLCAEADSPTEYEVKVAFIHNIAKFIEWPAARADTPLTLCILGEAPFGDALDGLRDKSIGDKFWEIAHVTDQSDLHQCRVLFISASESSNLSQIVDEIKNDAVLTIGESSGYAARGVIINFYLEQNSVYFEINKDAGVNAGFRISSQLLRLARPIKSRGGGK